MGQDATNYLPAGTRRQDVIEFLRLLAFKSAGRTRLGDHTARDFRFFNENDYLSWEPVWASVSEIDGEVRVDTRTRVWAGHYDLSVHNELLRQLRKRFGGYFRSDEGKNRYFTLLAPPVTPPQSGCYQAYTRAQSNLRRLKHHLRQQPVAAHPPAGAGVGAIDLGQLYLEPEIFSNNMSIPYLIAILEDYFRSTFVALVRYSPRKQLIFKRARLSAEQLEAVSDGAIGIEAATAESFPLHRVSAASRYFSELDPELDIAGQLRRPFRRRRVSIFETMEDLVELRHRIVHRAEQVHALTNDLFGDILLQAEVCVDRVYKHITARYGWEAYEPFAFGLMNRG
jgi:hypothetical protein